MAKSIKKQLEKYIEELKEGKRECDKYDTEEMIAESWVYEQVIERLENIISK